MENDVMNTWFISKDGTAAGTGSYDHLTRDPGFKLAANLFRYVLEDMLLKDVEENRSLQKELFKEADRIQNKQKKKKAERRLSDKGGRLSCDGSEDAFGEGSLMEDPEDREIEFPILRGNKRSREEVDIDTITEPSTSPQKLNLVEELQNMKTEALEIDEPEDVVSEVPPLELPEKLKLKLEQDYHLVNSRRRLHLLPAKPNIVCILELFVRHYAVQKLAQLEKQLAKSPYSQFSKLNSEKETEKYEEAKNHINICKEVAEGLRIIIDFQLGNILLYRKEEDQFEKASKLKPLMENLNTRNVSFNNHTDAGNLGQAGGRRHGVSESDAGAGQGAGEAGAGKKRTRLSSSVKEEAGTVASQSVGSTGGSSGTMTPTPVLGPGYPQSSKAHAVLEDVLNWRLVPDTLYLETPAPASLVYGGVHLARLLVKIPDILSKMRLSSKNAKKIVKYLEFLTEFLSTSHLEVFSENNYQ